MLTEPKWFLGSGRYLEEIAQAVSIPCLRKDFTVDEYMIYEAKILGASAVLLICSILSQSQLSEYLSLCDALGLSALAEAHDGAEAELAQRAGARIIGVNNRNLKDFSVDAENSLRLRQRIPEGVLFVSESGVQSAEDVSRLREAGADAVLVGEALMRAPDKKKKLAELRGTGAGRRNGRGSLNGSLGSGEGTIMTKMKFCGLSRPCDIKAANELKPAYIGFVFAPASRRYVPPERAEELKALLRPEISAVGVFVNEKPERIAELADRGIIDLIQLHGTEDEAGIRQVRSLTGLPVIKAFSIAGERDVEAANESGADYVLLDAGKGGTGIRFDWSLLSGMRRPYFLAGGLDMGNVSEAVERFHPYALDISSGIETDGVKDEKKMAAFAAE